MENYNRKTIRIPADLKILLDRTAKHVQLNISEIVRKCLRWSRKEVISKEMLKLYPKSKKEMQICVYLNELDLTPREKEKLIISLEIRCKDALSKPATCLPYQYDPSIIITRLDD